MKDFPETLNDGKRDYVLVRQAKELGGGIVDNALYNSVPYDGNEYTPNLEYVAGISDVPKMIVFEG